MTGPSSNAKGSTKKWSPSRNLWRRLQIFGFTLLCVAIDFSFILGWVWVHQRAEGGFKWLGSLPGLDGVIVDALKWLFTVGTLTLLVIYVVKDFVSLAAEIWKGD
ncbi:hypothetical protein ACH4S8_32455 [Streptomyces sp. NPDC021080]|uniref:hypothetical protein n=1 Tax=Streptomyces sp. NPDC021080 TaxID=3365110 RepID=UPI0037B3C9D1